MSLQHLRPFSGEPSKTTIKDLRIFRSQTFHYNLPFGASVSKILSSPAGFATEMGGSRITWTPDEDKNVTFVLLELVPREND